MLPESFFGLPVGFVNNMILLTKSLGSPKKLPGVPQEATKNCRAEILKIFLLLFWKIEVFINSFIFSLTDLNNSQLPWQFVVIGKSALISFRFQSSKNLCIILGDVHYYYGLKIFLKENSHFQLQKRRVRSSE